MSKIRDQVWIPNGVAQVSIVASVKEDTSALGRLT